MTTQEVLQIFKIHKEDFLMGLESDDSPVAFVLGGQPASGKTALAECCMNIYPAKRFLRINGDLYRQYCPGHNEIISNDIEHYSERTQIFSNVFTQELIKEAINRHLNVIVEGTMRNPDVPSGTVKMFHDAGFTTEVSIVAAPKEFSCINAMHRYQEQVEFEGFGRLPDMRSHDAAVEGVLKSADRLY